MGLGADLDVLPRALLLCHAGLQMYGFLLCHCRDFRSDGLRFVLVLDRQLGLACDMTMRRIGIISSAYSCK